MKTPMQEHIEWLKKEWKKWESAGELGVALHIGDCIEHAESMLEKEKEVIMDAWIDDRFPLDKEWAKRCAESYYNETFNTKEK